MQIDAKGRYGKHLVLGIQTNIKDLDDRIIYVAKSWAPSGCKSFSITKIIHTDYNGKVEEKPTGYADIHVSYFSTIEEGEMDMKGKIK